MLDSDADVRQTVGRQSIHYISCGVNRVWKRARKPMVAHVHSALDRKCRGASRGRSATDCARLQAARSESDQVAHKYGVLIVADWMEPMLLVHSAAGAPSQIPATRCADLLAKACGQHVALPADRQAWPSQCSRGVGGNAWFACRWRVQRLVHQGS
eukprot:792224-Pyramimonas_sp.AAC.1